MKCPKCGFENPPDLSYCGKCGTQIQPSEDIPITKTIESPKEELTTGSIFGDRDELVPGTGLGETEKVFFYLDRAYEKRDVSMFWLQTIPYLDDYCSDPRYVQLLIKMGLN